MSKEETGITVSYENADGTGTVTADKLLMSVGRRPVTKGFGLENLNLEWTERRCIKVDEHLQSSVPGVYVCGDLNGVSLLADRKSTRLNSSHGWTSRMPSSA